MWLGAIKLALNAGTHIYKKKQETKMLMADAQAQHASKMASGELEFSGKLLEARQNDYKDEVVLAIFFEHFQALPKWFTNLWVLVCASIFGIKGTQIFRNNGVKK
jgi:hypothetical protein